MAEKTTKEVGVHTTITQETKAKVAVRVGLELCSDDRWEQNDWGHDDDGNVIEITEGRIHGEFDQTRSTKRCFCLGGAIQFATREVLKLGEGTFGELHDREIAGMYTRMIGLRAAKESGLDTPHLELLTAWNDAKTCTFEDVRKIVVAVRDKTEGTTPERDEETAR